VTGRLERGAFGLWGRKEMSETRAGRSWTKEEEEDLVYKLAELIDGYSLKVKRTPGAVAARIQKVLDGSGVVHKAVREIRNNRRYHS